MIAREVDSYPIGLMCRVLQVSRSGFYAWRGRAPSARTQANAQLAARLRTLFAQHHGRYGTPRLHAVLQQAGVRVGRQRVARLLREQGCCGRLRRRWRHPSLARRQQLAVPNRLARQFAPAQAGGRDRVWVADLTYLRTAEGWLYLAVVLDLASRRVVGYATSAALDGRVSLAALRQACYTRRPRPGLLHHADRGYQYTSYDYRTVLTRQGAILSYSQPGQCADNAVVESFFATLKTELRTHQLRWSTRAEARAAVLDYVEWYNRTRLHSVLGYRSPITYEAEVLAASA